MSLDYRPRGSDGPMYNPERDLAHITPTVMMAAFTALDTENQLPHVRELLEEHRIDQEQLGEAAVKFVEAQRTFVYTSGITNPLDALKLSGFADLPSVVQDVVFASIGRILTGAWFYAVRRVTIVGDETPAAEDVARMISCGREVARQGGYTDIPAVPDEAELEYLRHRVAAMSTKLEQQRERLEVLETEKRGQIERERDRRERGGSED